MGIRQPVLGIFELDLQSKERFGDERNLYSESVDTQAMDQGPVEPLLFWDRSFWQVPFRQSVARGAYDGSRVLVGEAVQGIVGEGTAGTVEAARQLDGATDLIVGACGYFWATREALRSQTATPVITSGLEFLDLALRMTSRPVGIITWNDAALKRLLDRRPDFDRLRFVNVGDLPTWTGRMFFRRLDANAPPSESNKEALHMSARTKQRMGEELGQRLELAFASGGVFQDVSILVVECAAVPGFRNVIRSVTSVPVLDVAHFAKAALE